MPVKPLNVIEFEKMKEREKAELRDSSEWVGIANYYNKCEEIAQHNIAVHAIYQKMGFEPIGPVEYINGMFVWPYHSPNYVNELPDWLQNQIDNYDKRQKSKKGLV